MLGDHFRPILMLFAPLLLGGVGCGNPDCGPGGAAGRVRRADVRAHEDPAAGWCLDVMLLVVTIGVWVARRGERRLGLAIAAGRVRRGAIANRAALESP